MNDNMELNVLCYKINDNMELNVLCCKINDDIPDKIKVIPALTKLRPCTLAHFNWLKKYSLIHHEIITQFSAILENVIDSWSKFNCTI